MTNAACDIVQRRVTVAPSRTGSAPAAPAAPAVRRVSQRESAALRWQSRPRSGQRATVAAVLAVGLDPHIDEHRLLRSARQRLGAWCLRANTVWGLVEIGRAMNCNHSCFASWLIRAHAWPGPETPGAVLLHAAFVRNLRSGGNYGLDDDQVRAAYREISWAIPEYEQVPAVLAVAKETK